MFHTTLARRKLRMDGLYTKGTGEQFQQSPPGWVCEFVITYVNKDLGQLGQYTKAATGLGRHLTAG